MGRYLGAELIYGYNIGSAEDGWNFSELQAGAESKVPWPAWVKKDNYEGDGPEDLITQIIDRLLKCMGGFETIDWDYIGEDPRPQDYYQAMSDAEKKLGITYDMYGLEGWSGYILGYKLLESSGACEEVDLVDLGIYDYKAMSHKLKNATSYLSLHPYDQPEPKLYMIASYF